MLEPSRSRLPNLSHPAPPAVHPPPHRGSKAPGVCQPSQGLCRAAAGRRWRQEPRQVYVVAPAVLAPRRVPCPAHSHASRLGAGRGSARVLEFRVSSESRRAPPVLDHLCSGGALRAVPGPFARTSQPQPRSFKSSLVPPLPGSPLGTCLPSMERGCPWLLREAGAEIWAQDSGFPTLIFQNPSLLVFHLPCLIFPLWEGAVFSYRCWG